jgi:hypothetical protein
LSVLLLGFPIIEEILASSFKQPSKYMFNIIYVQRFGIEAMLKVCKTGGYN